MPEEFPRLVSHTVLGGILGEFRLKGGDVRTKARYASLSVFHAPIVPEMVNSW
jgi:hypothetical protein